MSKTKFSLSAGIRDQIQGLEGEDRNVLQTTMDVPTLTLDQVIESMVVIPNDLCEPSVLGVPYAWSPVVHVPVPQRGAARLLRLSIFPSPRRSKPGNSSLLLV